MFPLSLLDLASTNCSFVQSCNRYDDPAHLDIATRTPEPAARFRNGLNELRRARNAETRGTSRNR